MGIILKVAVLSSNTADKKKERGALLPMHWYSTAVASDASVARVSDGSTAVDAMPAKEPQKA